jgi:hypothetical protein
MLAVAEAEVHCGQVALLDLVVQAVVVLALLTQLLVLQALQVQAEAEVVVVALLQVTV